jgi:hypothetical protein
MDYRMLRYAAEIYAKYKLPILQEVIYIGASDLNMPLSIFFDVLENSKLDFSFGILDLGEVSMETLIETGSPLYPLLPLTERKSRKEDPRAFFAKLCSSNIQQPPLCATKT